ncbi:hypothetical protein [Micromonospora sp. NPDC092111]|uniref:hypothetical protein n=1 Tax=Micromonospora sp. NPDC092111 TaxID=3364289 RepID=UPI00380711B6
MTYYVLYRISDEAEPSGVFVVDSTEGHALVWDHRRRSWEYNPELVARFLDDHRNFGRYQEVDRAAGERAAISVTGGQCLPDVESIRRRFAQARGR